ncbi:MAG TPA: ABC transporter ATP-binding protein [Pirellulales bacterium]|nr:ABC transporter ATP-binding protein [Pirellulales bacterium]
METTILAHDVHKNYVTGGATTPVLQGVKLATRPGECVFLVGPSGSGKSTLLSILGCMLTPDRGRVEIVGRDLAGLSETERAVLRRDRIGFVFQRFQLIRGLNALENACLPLTLRGASPKESARRATELLQAVGLADKMKSHVGKLSAGQCQRVALARALAGDPDLILADEPTASLDGQNGQEVMGLLRRLTSEQGKTALVVTHDQRIFGYADRILHLDAGRVTEVDSEHPALTAGATSHFVGGTCHA